MSAHITHLCRFPLKGAAAVVEQHLIVNPTVGVLDDRRIAIRRRSGDLTQRGDGFNKQDFVVCANTAAMAKERPVFVGTNHELDPTYVESLRKLRPNDELVVQDTRGEYHLADTAGPQVSFINLATLRAFGEMMGVEIHPDRFRMNVWITGLPAFAEYDWVDRYPGTREILVGDIHMRIDDAAERCKAPHANPETGEFDLQITKALMEFMGQRGYKSPHRGVAHVMGIYGVVLNEGVLNVGDEIRLL